MQITLNEAKAYCQWARKRLPNDAEWMEEADTDHPTRGSWWYGAAQMHRDHVQTKPASTAVVYIGFRCAKSLP